MYKLSRLTYISTSIAAYKVLRLPRTSRYLSRKTYIFCGVKFVRLVAHHTHWWFFSWGVWVGLQPKGGGGGGGCSAGVLRYIYNRLRRGSLLFNRDIQYKSSHAPLASCTYHWEQIKPNIFPVMYSSIRIASKRTLKVIGTEILIPEKHQKNVPFAFGLSP